jgi:crotonobetainyl-CoA:carnitine CoA-transferase CaiB-like acyl-CoA transferase
MFGPILSPLDVIKDPQAIANDFFAEIDQPEVGRIKLINNPTKFCQDPAFIRSPAPLLSEQADEILASIGYSSQQIPQMRKDKVII